jgi:hypothetical protein
MLRVNFLIQVIIFLYSVSSVNASQYAQVLERNFKNEYIGTKWN